METSAAEWGFGEPHDSRVMTEMALVERSPAKRLEVVWSPGWYELRGKRIFDATIASGLLLALSPAMAAIAVTVRWRLGPGVMFHQQRVGQDGRPFVMLKFRTMLPDRRRNRRKPFNGHDRRRTHKDPNDPRHTRFGRLLRRTSLDELPQLFNVVRGDMSLVGPRPELVAVARDKGLLAHPRHRVRPGITGLWQVSPLRADADIADGLSLDSQYVADVSLRQDLAILGRTAGAVLRLAGS
jgi:lipopolysaccharide/colanic/teichoic acid biosynthesis glycosyltransferase